MPLAATHDPYCLVIHARLIPTWTRLTTVCLMVSLPALWIREVYQFPQFASVRILGDAWIIVVSQGGARDFFYFRDARHK